MRRARVPTLSGSRGGVRTQTRALTEHRDALAAQLRAELDVPGTPTGRAALVMLMGFPGVGKTHCARVLARRLGAAHVATDHIRSRLFIAASYADEENAAVFAAAQALVAGLLREGHTVVLDATHLRRSQRAAAVAAVGSAGAAVTYVLVTADDASTRERLLARSRGRGDGDHSDADVGVYERMRARGFEPPDEGYEEVHNGPDVERDIERVAQRVRRS